MSRHERRAMIDRGHHELSVVRQCELLDISRSSAYYSPVQADEYELELMGLVDKQYLLTPFYGSRKMAVWLRGQGHQVNRKRVQRLMRRMGIEAIYRRPRTTMPDSGHKVYPYLLRGLEIDRVNQVWAADITYIPMVHEFMYLVCVMDWHSRYVLSWRLSNTLEADSCVDALEEALSRDLPGVFNTDQGSQFTSEAFTSVLVAHGVRISMDSSRQLHGQCVRGAAVEEREVRGGVSEGVRECGRGQGRNWSLPEILQQRAPSPDPRLQNPGPGVRGRKEPGTPV